VAWQPLLALCPTDGLYVASHDQWRFRGTRAQEPVCVCVCVCARTLCVCTCLRTCVRACVYTCCTKVRFQLLCTHNVPTRVLSERYDLHGMIHMVHTAVYVLTSMGHHHSFYFPVHTCMHTLLWVPLVRLEHVPVVPFITSSTDDNDIPSARTLDLFCNCQLNDNQHCMIGTGVAKSQS